MSATVAVVLLVMTMNACDDAGSGLSGASHPQEAFDDYWNSCPDVPVFDRNVDLVSDAEAFRSPQAAVRSVSDQATEVVAIHTTGRSSEVDVRRAGELGTFFVQHRSAGWVVKGGQGCAAWPAARAVLGFEDSAPVWSDVESAIPSR